LPIASPKTVDEPRGVFRLFESRATEAALEAGAPEGSSTLRFNQTGEPERVIALTMPATPGVIPKLANYTEAQAIDATKDFTLRWTAFSPQRAGAVVRVVADVSRRDMFRAY
jgi:hypothetical protein